MTSGSDRAHLADDRAAPRGRPAGRAAARSPAAARRAARREARAAGRSARCAARQASCSTRAARRARGAATLSSDCDSAATASATCAPLATPAWRSPARAATLDTTPADSTSARSKVAWSPTSSCVVWRACDSAGLSAASAASACFGCVPNATAPPWTSCCSDVRACASSVLSSWSRSTIGRVSSPLIAPPSAIFGFEFGPGCSATWRPATLDSDVLRIVAIVPSCSGLKRGSSIRSVICAWLSLVRSIACDRPDGDAADLHEVALDELARALHERAHLVARSAAAQQHRADHDQRDREQHAQPLPQRVGGSAFPSRGN